LGTMRQIKFRAQDIASNKWLYGDLRHHKDDVCIFEQGGTKGEQVKRDTVGQFTGLRDINGKDIYEGDILRSPSGNIVAVEFGYKEHIVKHGWPNITDSFACYGWIARNVKKGITDFFDNEFAAGEVIGNIYDNPELIAEDMNIQIRED